jgi:hypothetical protein
VKVDTIYEEMILVKVEVQDKKEIFLNTTYRSPTSSEENNVKLLELIKQMNDKYKNVICVGDFNIGDIDGHKWTSSNAMEGKSLGIFTDYCVNQFVDRPARARAKDNPRILDLVLGSVNLINNIDYLSPLGKGDH